MGIQSFAKLDLRYGYHHIRMDPKDIQKKTFRTKQYEYLVVPFGLVKTLSTFQQLIKQVLDPILEGLY